MKENAGNPLHLTSLNHVALLCQSVDESMNFYHKVLGFIPIRRPGSLNFEGAWLFGHGIGIHILRSPKPAKLTKKTAINPKANHISFQCESMDAVEKKLEEMKIEYVRALVEEGGIQVDQLFFHDPDGFMIEICNCDSLPVVPRSSPRRRNDSVLIKSQTPPDGAATTANSYPPSGPPLGISLLFYTVFVCVLVCLIWV